MKWQWVVLADKKSWSLRKGHQTLVSIVQLDDGSFLDVGTDSALSSTTLENAQREAFEIHHKKVVALYLQYAYAGTDMGY